MELEFDLILAHLVIFLIVLWACKKLYVEPILKLLKKREALTSGRKDTTQDLHESMQKMKQEYAKSWESAKESFEKKRETQLKELRDQQTKRISTLKRDLENKLLERQTVLEKELHSLESKIPMIAGDLAKEIEMSLMKAKVVER